MMIELRRDPFEPACCIVTRDGEWLGDVEELADGTWQGDITQGNGPPSKPYATQMEAVAYVVNCGQRDPRQVAQELAEFTRPLDPTGVDCHEAYEGVEDQA